jgi:hypothetical protein
MIEVGRGELPKGLADEIMRQLAADFATLALRGCTD